MTEPAQGELLDLADAFPGEVELFADLFESAGNAVIEAVCKAAVEAGGSSREGCGRRERRRSRWGRAFRGRAIGVRMGAWF